MERSSAGAERLRPHRIDVALVATVVVMATVSAILVSDPSISLVVVDRTLDVAMTTITALAAGGLALLTMPRYRESGRVSMLLQTSAFTLMFAFAGITVLAVLLKLDGRLGMTLGLPEQYPLYVSNVFRLATAGLLLAAAVASALRSRPRLGRPRWRLILPFVVLSVGTVAIYPFREALPPLIDAPGMDALIADPQASSTLPGTTGLTLAFVAAIVVALGAAALLYRFTFVRGGPVYDGFLAVALVILAFSEAHYAFYPTVYTGLVTVSDLFRLIGFGVLLAGIQAEQQADLRALRAAYQALDRLRISEADRAALEERSRLAREIHDGLAQHLWFAKLKFERLAGQVPEESRPLAGEVTQALDTAIVEARQALVTMRTSLGSDMPLTDMLTRTIDDFSHRSGIRVEIVAGTSLPSAIPPRQQVELLRIVQEALTNVQKHADATVVRVRAEVEGRDLVVVVSDNGRGFELATAIDRGMGIQGMEERARLMGGQLRVTSEPSNGTAVQLAVPLLLPVVLPAPGELALPGMPDVAAGSDGRAGAGAIGAVSGAGAIGPVAGDGRAGAGDGRAAAADEVPDATDMVATLGRPVP